SSQEQATNTLTGYCARCNPFLFTYSADFRHHLRSHLRQHCWRSQLYAWLDTGNGSGQYVIVLLQLQPAYQRYLRGPESRFHGDTLLGNRNTLQLWQFKVRRVCGSVIDEEDPTILNLLFSCESTRERCVLSHRDENSCTCSRVASDDRARLFISNDVSGLPRALTSH